MKAIPPIIYIIICATLSSCFTGVDSTPRISSADVDAAGISDSREMALMQAVRDTPPVHWAPGKEWLVDDDKIALIFAQPAVGADSLAGHRIALVSKRNVTDVTGRQTVELLFRSDRGDSLCYPTGIDAESFEQRRSLEIPFAINLDAVHTADSLLRGCRCFITTPLWYEANGRSIHGLRHVPVTIDSVVAGTSNLPLRVAFSADEIPGEHFVWLTYGSSRAATRNFDRLFSFSDPRTNYPQISDHTWQLIARSQVAVGMTRDECRLALGAPSSINRGATRAAQLERWLYDNGIYLIFEDGILTRYRK